jgi:hypothetical protein
MLCRAIGWRFLEDRFGAVYFDKAGHPPLPTRCLQSSSTGTICRTRTCVRTGSRNPIASCFATKSSSPAAPVLPFYQRGGKHALIAHQRYAHAKQFKRANRALKTIRTYLDRVIRDIVRKIKGWSAEKESLFVATRPFHILSPDLTCDGAGRWLKACPGPFRTGIFGCVE